MHFHRLRLCVLPGMLLLVGVGAYGEAVRDSATYTLPNGWKISPLGDALSTSDLISRIVSTPKGADTVAITSGYNRHQLLLISGDENAIRQRIDLHATFYGLCWDPPGARLFVSGGNNSSSKGIRAPVYVFDYAGGALSEKPVAELSESIDPKQIYWSGLVHHPTRAVLYAANRTAGQVVVFDTAHMALQARIDVEVNPYATVLSPDGATLYVSNWASDSVSVIDTESLVVTATIRVGDNPSDMVMHKDGRIFVVCANDNAVSVVDPAQGRAIETIVTSLYPNAPEGSTPNALALDPAHKTLYVANADNNNVCVIEVEEPGESEVLGFIPAGWYPSAVWVGADGRKLFVGNAKGGQSSANVHGPHSPLGPNAEGVVETTKSTIQGSINIVDIPSHRKRLRELSRQCYENSPYNDELLARARKPEGLASVVPTVVGQASPIKHVLYIIKENRTYDQVFGDLPQGNGDPELCLFGRDITPNHHKLAEEFVLLDNLYCDAEVSVDGHSWSNAAYATDFNEKTWPASYGGKAAAPYTQASLPASGYLWDQCFKKGLTYRSYGEFARRKDEGGEMTPHVGGLMGHVAPHYLSWGARDTDNAKEFIREFEAYEANFDSPDPEKRLPHYVVLALPEDHTHGTSPGKPTPRACVASNDYALGMIVDRVSHSKYWEDMAIFVIEDDAQDGSDHVDARRTIGFCISPYTRRGTVDSTFYTTSSMLRTMELLLGLGPMSQFDAAATPLYASLGTERDLAPYEHLEPRVDINEVNIKTAWGAGLSEKMDWTDIDRTPMYALNEIVWKSVKGADSVMPLPVHRFVAESLLAASTGAAAAPEAHL